MNTTLDIQFSALMSCTPPPGIAMQRVSLRADDVDAGGEIIRIDLDCFAFVQRISEDVRTRDIIDDALVENDPRSGRTIQEFVAAEDPDRDVVWGTNVTQGHFWETNTLVIDGGRVISREPGRRGLNEESGSHHPHGEFWVLGLDEKHRGLWKMELDNDGKPVGAIPVRDGFAGPVLIKSGRSVLDFVPACLPPLSGNEVNWETRDQRMAMTAFGYDASKRLVIVQLAGNPDDPRQPDPSVDHLRALLLRLELTDALLGGTSGDVQRWAKFCEPSLRWAKGRSGSRLQKSIATPNGQRRLGHALLFYPR